MDPEPGKIRENPAEAVYNQEARPDKVHVHNIDADRAHHGRPKLGGILANNPLAPGIPRDNIHEPHSQPVSLVGDTAPSIQRDLLLYVDKGGDARGDGSSKSAHQIPAAHDILHELHDAPSRDKSILPRDIQGSLLGEDETRRKRSKMERSRENS